VAYDAARRFEADCHAGCPERNSRWLGLNKPRAGLRSRLLAVDFLMKSSPASSPTKLARAHCADLQSRRPEDQLFHYPLGHAGLACVSISYVQFFPCQPPAEHVSALNDHINILRLPPPRSGEFHRCVFVTVKSAVTPVIDGRNRTALPSMLVELSLRTE